jgi:hypothetical protein
VPVSRKSPEADLEPITMAKHSIARGFLQSAWLAVCLAMCAGPPLAAAAIPDQPKTSGTQPSVHKPAHTRKHTAAKPSPAVPAQQIAAAPAAPVAPPPPNWPVNDKAVAATVAWDSHGLRVDANNSSLAQILQDVSTDTGAKVEGLAQKDVRVFGTYGPGPANEVLSQLLNGTGYNVLMIGDQGSGAPRQIVLTTAPRGPAPQNNARNTNNGDDDNEPDQQIQEPPPVINGGFPPPSSPQQMQEEQLRQEQMQQQLRQQMINQQMQQQQLPPDNAAPPQQH